MNRKYILEYDDDGIIISMLPKTVKQETEVDSHPIRTNILMTLAFMGMIVLTAIALPVILQP